METAEPLETGYGRTAPAGDNLCNDFHQGLADGYAALALARGARLRRDADVTMADRSSPSLFENFAVVHQPLGDGEWTEAAGRIHAFFAPQPGGNFLVFSAWPTPDLTALGFGRVGHPPLMLRQAGPLATATGSGLAIRPVEDAATARDWELAFVRGFPAPELEPVEPGCVLPVEALAAAGWRHWVGYLDGEAVATASALVGPTHVHVEFIACVPAARGRGIGGAMTAHATLVQPDLPAMLIASDLGQPVYRRLGYRSMLRFTLWAGHRGG